MFVLIDDCQSSQPGSQCAKRPLRKPLASLATSDRRGRRRPFKVIGIREELSKRALLETNRMQLVQVPLSKKLQYIPVKLLNYIIYVTCWSAQFYQWCYHGRACLGRQTSADQLKHKMFNIAS